MVPLYLNVNTKKLAFHFWKAYVDSDWNPTIFFEVALFYMS